MFANERQNVARPPALAEVAIDRHIARLVAQARNGLTEPGGMIDDVGGGSIVRRLRFRRLPPA